MILLIAALFSRGSHPDAEIQVLHNKLGSFDFEELESNLYRVEISSNPISAAASVAKEEPWERSGDMDVESSSLLSEDKADYGDETRPQPQQVSMMYSH